jgi:ADP-heptose:LPS heptosyltransferase
VGLVWAGNQQHKNDANRSIPFADLMPLFQIPNIDWFSLQFGNAAAQISENNLSQQLHDLSPRLHNFSDTAAAMSALDLVISVDTSAAHLAGALGCPCLLMLSTTPDWRWAGNEAASPWYPNHQLFRQQIPGDWQAVVALIVESL